MKKQIVTALALFLLFGWMVISCKKDPDSTMEMKEIWDCHHQKEWTITSTQNVLNGIWELEKGGLYSADAPGTPKEQTGKYIEFRNDSVFAYNQDWELLVSANGQIVDGDAGLFELELGKSIVGLYGRILICDGLLLFNHSYIDGADTYFRKME